MESKVDMTYSFLWDTEPTDEQLEMLMQEVGETVRQKKAAAAIRFNEQMQLELTKSRKEYQTRGENYGKI
ncbi:MAG: hypothetical protein LBV31_03325 [Prevotellaceae bacterium]|jgi:hypothetical protein|nr:hypothetical protein [Prevotellaceae bacterium]